MSLCWTLEPSGAFICGDMSSRITAYSYPTSPNATSAARAKSVASVERLVKDILAKEASGRCGVEHEAVYDANNWRRLNSEMEA